MVRSWLITAINHDFFLKFYLIDFHYCWELIFHASWIIKSRAQLKPLVIVDRSIFKQILLIRHRFLLNPGDKRPLIPINLLVDANSRLGLIFHNDWDNFWLWGRGRIDDFASTVHPYRANGSTWLRWFDFSFPEIFAVIRNEPVFVWWLLPKNAKHVFQLLHNIFCFIAELLLSLFRRASL